VASFDQCERAGLKVDSTRELALYSIALICLDIDFTERLLELSADAYHFTSLQKQ
jgi:hypothetical protein